MYMFLQINEKHFPEDYWLFVTMKNRLKTLWESCRGKEIIRELLLIINKISHTFLNAEIIYGPIISSKI